jgi:hypothetical protein
VNDDRQREYLASIAYEVHFTMTNTRDGPATPSFEMIADVAIKDIASRLNGLADGLLNNPYPYKRIQPPNPDRPTT